MRRDGLRIDPKARPYGMHVIDALVDAVERSPLPIVVTDPGSLHGRRLVERLGVRVGPTHVREGASS